MAAPAQPEEPLVTEPLVTEDPPAELALLVSPGPTLESLSRPASSHSLLADGGSDTNVPARAVSVQIGAAAYRADAPGSRPSLVLPEIIGPLGTSSGSAFAARPLHGFGGLGLGASRAETRVDVPFPELPSDADTEVPSWRTGLHSDWSLIVGSTTYRVHKVLTGHGARASAFLCSAFTTGQQLLANGCSEDVGATDLSHILPEPIWHMFSDVLDYIYTGELRLSSKNAVPLLRCADALQIKSLFLECIRKINEFLTVDSAPQLLADTVELLGGTLAEQIIKAAQDIIAEHFEVYPASELKKIPIAQLAQILRRDDLDVMHENEVFDRVHQIVEELKSEDVFAASSAATSSTAPAPDACAACNRLWQTIRIGALSNGYFVKAAHVDAIPKLALIRAKALHKKCGSSMLQDHSMLPNSGGDEWSTAPARPRRPFKNLVCAVMYSVDTDARNDQDVERNITAATLVAEEIEYLGGRAILENIFARTPLKDSAEASIINMDQVDVAFVLAPWTPSGQRIARLINFVDHGGGAVLLSFIGGLSKGPWLDGQYEPLITGKVAESAPYEDVFLPSHSILGSMDSLRRFPGQQTSRILSGVDSINGRRRITSELVEGAKVLAQWSDWQPLVVQHPTKNVFSISQRVSRIFELDDELGHDDTLQLVLNTMLCAGREARRVRGRRGPRGSVSSANGAPSFQAGASREAANAVMPALSLDAVAAANMSL